ncbi:hypothetical protein GBL_0914 [Geobacillus kaustophilus GBlys]|uniref:Uncharacterized protein n=1 Tax=Geobacillus kaustophilus GBlys TaxID=1337888 RepID=U2X2H5_GEOKU|nr:hypothetical protein GBL_0914 [Geobacillus kaustophilus GBlys]
MASRGIAYDKMAINNTIPPKKKPTKTVLPGTSEISYKCAGIHKMIKPDSNSSVAPQNGRRLRQR